MYLKNKKNTFWLWLTVFTKFLNKIDDFKNYRWAKDFSIMYKSKITPVAKDMNIEFVYPQNVFASHSMSVTQAKTLNKFMKSCPNRCPFSRWFGTKPIDVKHIRTCLRNCIFIFFWFVSIVKFNVVCALSRLC